MDKFVISWQNFCSSQTAIQVCFKNTAVRFISKTNGDTQLLRNIFCSINFWLINIEIFGIKLF